MSYKPFETSMPFVYVGAAAAVIGGLAMALLTSVSNANPWALNIAGMTAIGGFLLMMAFALTDLSYELRGK